MVEVELLLVTLLLGMSSEVPNLGVRPPSKDHQINLRGHEMINKERKEDKKQSSATQICFNLLDGSLVFWAFIVSY